MIETIKATMLTIRDMICGLVQIIFIIFITFFLATSGIAGSLRPG